jgi:hypothetical protein
LGLSKDGCQIKKESVEGSEYWNTGILEYWKTGARSDGVPEQNPLRIAD